MDMRGKNQLPAETVVSDRRLSSKRVHVERIIGLAKRYKILNEELNTHYVVLGEKIIFVCFALLNFQNCIVPDI